MHYKIRRWNDSGKFTWELWRQTRRGWWLFDWYEGELLSKHDTEAAALGAMAARVGGHYDLTEDYDCHGRRILYAWA